MTEQPSLDADTQHAREQHLTWLLHLRTQALHRVIQERDQARAQLQRIDKGTN